MALPQWPASLPTGFDVRGLTYGLKSNVAVTQPDVGRSRTRRRSTARVFLVAGSMILQRDAGGVDQVAVWEKFLHEDLKDGSTPFMWVDPMHPPARYRTELYIPGDANAEFTLIASDLGRLITTIPQVGSRALRLALQLEMVRR